MEVEFREKIRKGARELGMELSIDALGQCVAYAELLEGWNRKINLTRVKSEDFAVLHFIDSLYAASALGNGPKNASLVDIGTGAGFPGMVLKIAYPWLNVTLIDSVNKKLKFLECVIKELSLTGMELVHGRAEDVCKMDRYNSSFDYATSRGVAELSTVIRWSIPFLKEGGKGIAMKGPRGGKLESEIEEVQNSRLKREVDIDIREYTLSGSIDAESRGRTIVVFFKV